MSKPCPKAKKNTGKLRFRGDKEYSCTPSCGFCHGRAFIIDCPDCQGCGMCRGVKCATCGATGKRPEPLKYTA